MGRRNDGITYGSRKDKHIKSCPAEDKAALFPLPGAHLSAPAPVQEQTGMKFVAA